MRRLLILLLTFSAAPAFAFRIAPPPGARIGVLRMSGDFAHGAEGTVAKTVQNDLREELKALGFKAFDAEKSWEQIASDPGPDADLYVEVISSYATNRPVAGAGAGNGSVGIDVAVVVSQVAAAVRVYDGRTLQLLNTYDLQQKATAVLPTSLGLGGRFFWARIPLPFVHYAQYRSAAHAVAEQAAARIAGR